MTVGFFAGVDVCNRATHKIIGEQNADMAEKLLSSTRRQNASIHEFAMSLAR